MKRICLIYILLMSAALSLTAQTESATFVRRAVVEEYTGTWCGNCPRGIVGLQRLTEDFGDRVIPIAVHSGDVMEIAAYPALQPGDGIPACNLDRKGKLDPYNGGGTRGFFHYGIDVEVASELEQPVEAGITLTAQWNDAQLWDVRFTATTIFNINSPEAPYRLAFILLEDGLTGEGKQWEQVNYFSYEEGTSNFADDDMKEWRDAPYNVGNMVYNHVPVNTLGIKDGIAGSIQAPIVSGTPQTYSNIVTTLNVRVIQDKSHLSAVVLLLNTETGEIVNAAKADILPYGTDAVQTVAIPNRPNGQSLNDLQGRRVSPSSQAKGVYIRNHRKFIK